MIILNKKHRHHREMSRNGRAHMPYPFAPRDDLAPSGNYELFVNQVQRMLAKQEQIGMALVLGDIGKANCNELKGRIAQLGEHIAYTTWGPVAAIIFQRHLFEHLVHTWQDYSAGVPGSSAGIAFPWQAAEAPDLFLAARLALSRSIAHHHDLIAFDGSESEIEIANYRLACSMKQDLDSGGEGFDAHFQPLVHLLSGWPIGAEVLARWRDGAEAVPPGRFIPVAEDSGLIGQIGEIMLDRGAHAVARLRHGNIAIPRVSVNVSPGQMHWNDFLRTALDIVHDWGLSTADIELEVTESTAANGSNELIRWMDELAEAGFSIAIDDFGTGASSLARIREIPASKIKLDRAFVAPLPHDERGCRFCDAALKLTHSVGMTSLAEGVETPEQAGFLGTCGCSQGQGYLWARPMPIGQLETWWLERTAGSGG